MRRRIKTVPIPFNKGLNTEAISALTIDDGENTALSNFRELSGALLKRYGMNKLRTETSLTGVGLKFAQFNGVDNLVAMYSTGAIRMSASPYSSWSTLDTDVTNTTSTSRLLSLARYNAYNEDGTQKEYLIFADGTDAVRVYEDGEHIKDLITFCPEEGMLPETVPDIRVSRTLITKQYQEGSSNTPSIVVRISNQGYTLDSWTASSYGTLSLTLNGGATASGGPIIEGGYEDLTIAIAQTSGLSVGTHSAVVAVSFSQGQATINIPINIIIITGWNNATVIEHDLNFQCERGSYPDATIYTNQEFISFDAGYDVFQTPGEIVYDKNKAGWVSVTPDIDDITETTTYAVALDSDIISTMPADIYTACIPISSYMQWYDWPDTWNGPTTNHTVVITLVVTEAEEDAYNFYTPSKARAAVAFGGSLVLMNVTEKANREGMTSAIYPNRIVWSDAYDMTKFGINSWEDMPERGGAVSGVLGGVVFGGALYIFSNNSVHRMNSTGNPDLRFTFDYDLLDVGCKYMDTVIVTRNFIVFEASDGTRRAFDGFKSYILNQKNLARDKAAIPTSSAYDSPYGRYIYNSSVSTTRLGLLSLRGANNLPQGATSESVDTLADLDLFEETYPQALSFLAYSPTNVFTMCQSGADCYIGQLWDSTKTQDFGTTDISYSALGKQYVIGPNKEAKVEAINVYGYTNVTTPTPTCKITVYCEPGSYSVVTNLALTAPSVKIPIERSAETIQVKIENSTSVSTRCDIYKIDAVLHGVREK